MWFYCFYVFSVFTAIALMCLWCAFCRILIKITYLLTYSTSVYLSIYSPSCKYPTQYIPSPVGFIAGNCGNTAGIFPCRCLDETMLELLTEVRTSWQVFRGNRWWHRVKTLQQLERCHCTADVEAVGLECRCWTVETQVRRQFAAVTAIQACHDWTFSATCLYTFNQW